MICKRKPEKQHVHACAKTLPRRWLITLEVIKLQNEPRTFFYAARNMHSQVCAELSSSLGSCQRADVLRCALWVVLFCFKLQGSMEPILRMLDILWQVPDLASQPKPGWAQRWMACLPCGSWPLFLSERILQMWAYHWWSSLPRWWGCNGNTSKFPLQEAAKSLEDRDRSI